MRPRPPRPPSRARRRRSMTKRKPPAVPGALVWALRLRAYPKTPLCRGQEAPPTAVGATSRLALSGSEGSRPRDFG